jgi:PAS domain S-box-containing protein
MMAEKPTHKEINQKEMLPKTTLAQWPTTFDAINDAVCLLDMNGKILQCNKAMESFLKKSSKEIIGSTCWKLVHGTDKPVKGCPIVRMKKTLCRETLVLEVDDKWLNVSVDPLIDETGNLAGAVHIISDITQRKQREEAIKECKERYRGLSEAGFEAIFISEKGVCLEQNSTAEKMFGYTLSEAIGRKGTEWIAPEDREMVMDNMLSGYKEPYEVTALQKDGSTFPAEIQGKMMHYKGRTVRVTALNDITKRKQAEEELRKSEQRFRSIFENIPNIAVQGYDADRKIIFWNQASEKLYGYKKEEAIGNQLEDLIIPPEMREFVIEAVRNWVENGIPIPHGELKLMRKDKTTFPVYSSHIILKNIKGEFEMYCIDIDMTERKHAEEALLNSEKRLHYLSSQLITAQEKERRRISLELHDEMGQLLTAISINIKSIEKELPLDLTPLIKERIAETYSLADHASEQIRELSHYLRPSMLDDLGLVPTLRWYLDVYRKRTKLDVKYEPINFKERPSPEVETVIYRVVQEALNNIVKHAQAGSVLVRLERKDKETAVFIKDNGRGFDVNEFLAPDDLKGGIGLLGMQERVSILGGKFSIQSSKGRGTRISVEIPWH